jgi:hypothetical protein
MLCPAEGPWEGVEGGEDVPRTPRQPATSMATGIFVTLVFGSSCLHLCFPQLSCDFISPFSLHVCL